MDEEQVKQIIKDELELMKFDPGTPLFHEHTGLDSPFIRASSILDATGWIKLADVSLSAATATLDSGIILPKEHLKIYVYISSFSANDDGALQFNSDTGNNYAYAVSKDGGVTAKDANQDRIFFTGVFPVVRGEYMTFEIFNIADSKKLMTGQGQRFSDGAAISNIIEQHGVWNNTSDSITSVQLLTKEDNLLSSNTRMIIYGS